MLVEPVQIRPETAARHPLNDRASIGERMVVGSPPDVHVGWTRPQSVVVVGNRSDRLASYRRDKPRTPGSGRRYFLHEHVRRLIEIVGHLHGQDTARSKRLHQAPHDLKMTGDPMEYGVGEN